ISQFDIPIAQGGFIDVDLPLDFGGPQEIWDNESSYGRKYREVASLVKWGTG
ncbi:hypothetical protein GIB67_028621, partial [Kingdonia uniflora]